LYYRYFFFNKTGSLYLDESGNFVKYFTENGEIINIFVKKEGNDIWSEVTPEKLGKQGEING